MTKEEYEETKEDNQNHIDALRAEISELEKRICQSGTIMDSPWVQALLEYGRLTELDRETVVTLVRRIEIFEDKTIKITYKFSDEFDDLFSVRFS